MILSTGGVYLVWSRGGCTWSGPGGCTWSGPGGCTWSGSRGVYLVWSWGGVPGLVLGGVPGRHPPGPGTPQDQVHLPDQVPPQDQVHPGTKYTPRDQVHPPGSSRLRNTVNERPVRILLECILVDYVCRGADGGDDTMDTSESGFHCENSHGHLPEP